ncbi:hypothetical protein JKF63_00200 [Porcisia hertigi]|uniref:Uncharacterized protein n=1 Tax=Porcisia hertigi TaxID=2761500 RepID=A0A836HB77_9TRYP|nr:hypothetical protein JKF63_00200 [Porcisia hertigi]
MPDQRPAVSCASQPLTTLPVVQPSTQLQQLVERGPHDTLVQHSPYGQSRNTIYGWGNLFQRPLSATIPSHPYVHIGISSLNGVPTVGRSDRSMRSLLTRYRMKFNCLEHCYPYHKVGDTETWRAWAAMVKDSSVTNSGTIGPATAQAHPSHATKGTVTAGLAAAEPSPLRPCVVNARRFLYAIKANNFLTHVKQLDIKDAEVAEHVQVFFRERCRALEPYLGPVLIQLPPSFGYSPENIQRLTRLYQVLPHEGAQMQETMPRSLEDASSVGTSSTPAPASAAGQSQQRLRVAVEFRNRSWYREETFALLRSLRWALVVAHHHDDLTYSRVVDTGAGFLYIRLHGPLGRNVGDYGPLAMRLWAEEILQYLHPTKGGIDSGRVNSAPCETAREVFVFLNNSDSHIGGTASSVVDATCLAEQLRGLLSCASSMMSPARSVASYGAPVMGTDPPVVASIQVDTALSVAKDSQRTPQKKYVESGADARPVKRQRTALRSSVSRHDETVID